MTDFDANYHQQALQEIKARADLHIKNVKEAFGIALNYDEQSIFRLDDIIEHGWLGAQPANLKVVVELFGCYFGQVLTVVLGGKWKFSPEHKGWLIELIASDGTIARANIFSKIAKRFKNGQVDSLSYYYQMMKKGMSDNFAFKK